MSNNSFWRIVLGMLLAWTLGFAPGSSWSQQVLPVPELTARLMDQTGTLTSDEQQALEKRLAGLEAASGSQVVVLMVSTTAPEDIAPYAHRVASTWKIGRRDVGDGVLVIVAKDDRRMRIEVARALEGAIPDLAASRIIDQQMAPHFRNGQYAQGIALALDQIGARIANESLPAPSSTSAASSASSMEDILFMAGAFVVFIVPIVGMLMRSILGKTLGSIAMGIGSGYLVSLFTASWFVAIVLGFVAMFATFFMRSAPMHIGGGRGGHGGRAGGWGGVGGGWGGGGGFSSGGGGSFGGGGASGSW